MAEAGNKSEANADKEEGRHRIVYNMKKDGNQTWNVVMKFTQRASSCIPDLA
jgi:hypothetical protein